MDWLEKYYKEYEKYPETPTYLLNFVKGKGGAITFGEARKLVEKAKSMPQEGSKPAAAEPPKEPPPKEEPPAKEEPAVKEPPAAAAAPPPPPTATIKVPTSAPSASPALDFKPPPRFKKPMRPTEAKAELHKEHATLTTVADIFLACDLDGDGAVTKSEMLRACDPSNPVSAQIREKLGVSSTETIDKLFAEIDVDHDAKLTYTELQNHVAKSMSKQSEEDDIPHHVTFSDLDVTAALSHSLLGRRMDLEEQEKKEDDPDSEESEAEDVPAVPPMPRVESVRVGSATHDAETTGASSEGEDWKSFVERSRQVLTEAGLKEDPAELYRAFLSESDPALCYAIFACAISKAAPPGSEFEEPWDTLFPYDAFKSVSSLNFREKQLLKKFDKRVNLPEYASRPCTEGRLKDKIVVVVGAGPCGLRTAIEMRLLGASVTLVESREAFTRLNQLHIWSWVSEDLKGLGAGTMSPPDGAFSADPVVLHVSIEHMQTHLFKVALLLGVEILMDTSFVNFRWEAGGWVVDLKQEGGKGISPKAPSVLRKVGAVIPANGFGSEISDLAGMHYKEVTTGSAIGLTCNVKCSEADVLSRNKSFTKVYQFYQRQFDEAEKKVGASFENLLYTKPYKGCKSHYFVMTPKMQSLLNKGVVKDPVNGVTDAANLDKEQLDKLAKDAINFRWVEGEKGVLEELIERDGKFPGWADNGPRLFDFSKTKQSEEGMKFMQSPDSSSDDNALPVVLVGDALMEPFWPQGLGTIRGFFGGLDACFAIKKWCAGSKPIEAEESFRAAFGQLSCLSSFRSEQVLKTTNFKTYGLDPATRYKNFPG